MTAYAHSLPTPCPPERWETIEDHHVAVGQLAGDFAGAFNAREWGRVIGHWHDLGKYSDAFQRYIRQSADPDAGEHEDAPGRVDHSTFGAQHAARTLPGHIGQVIAFCIAGHHGHLPDATSGDEATVRSTLQARLKAGPDRVPQVVLPDIPPHPSLKVPFKPSANVGFQIAFFTRMLFSCLIDADRTATERFCNNSQASERAQSKPSVIQLCETVDEFLRHNQRTAPSTPVNAVRAKVLADCLSAATSAPGFFSLQVPTGGGKTLASLAFALHHAQAHDLRCVVVAIPFTSIIEQTADVYREALGPLAESGLIEHHSNIEPRKDTRQNKLAAENWDAPLVVTTNVQLFESLFASRTTPCRKLHRLARSVIILDEAQTLPVEYLKPTLLALRELVANYGCTVVLCTATQPALERREGFDIGIEGVRPIIDDPQALHQSLRRAKVERLGVVSDDDLAERLAAERSALCIVNSRAHAATLHDATMSRSDAEDCFHLSTFMCAQHRREKLAIIRQRLKDERPCRVISTQLIEAGVDVDFPVVYRAPAGFDSIAQAAGRCNREGKLDCGRVFVFETESSVPPGLQRQAAQAARELIDLHEDLISPQAIEAYFRLFYWSQSHQWDKKNVVPQFRMEMNDPTLYFQFRTAASLYCLIEDAQSPVLVPYDGQARRLRDRLQRGEPIDYHFHREAQRYIVGVRANSLSALCDGGVVMSHESGLWWLVNDDAYTCEKGLIFNKSGIDPESLMG